MAQMVRSVDSLTLMQPVCGWAKIQTWGSLRIHSCLRALAWPGLHCCSLLIHFGV